jgi:hypothetical protein
VIDGTYTVKATDLAANTSTVGSFVIDTTAPAKPTVDAQATVLTQPTISGTFDPADAVGGFTVTVDGRTYTLGVNPALIATGNTWTLDLAVAGQTLAVGVFEVVAKATDVAGNVSTDTNAAELTVNPVPLSPPASAPPVAPDAQPVITVLPSPVVGEVGRGPASNLILFENFDLNRSAPADLLTSGVEGASRIAVVKAAEPGLFRFHGVPDQDFDTGTHVRFQLPADAFMHTQENAIVRIVAERTDGGPLPSWLVFNATTGTFEGTAPLGSPNELDVKVIARDSDGREASTIFRIKLHAGEKVRPTGRLGLTDQIRMGAHRPTHIRHMAALERVGRTPTPRQV